MISIIYVSAVILFVFCFFLLKPIRTFNSILSITLWAIETFSNHLLEDQVKQKYVQKAALSVLKNFFILSIKIFFLIISALLPVYLADYYSAVSFQEIINFALRSDIILLSLLVSVFLYALWLKLFAKRLSFSVAGALAESVGTEKLFVVNYSRLDKAIHNIYFSSTNLQKILFSLEKKIFSKNWKNVSAQRPVFLTSLPRSGTTILLESLSKLPNFSTHTYRDMPFIFSPVLWSRFSLVFQKSSAKKQRMHGDGLLVNEDSPEALEEAIWLKYFPQKYTSNKIYLWKNTDVNFKNFFNEYMQGIIFLRNSQHLENSRYLSKNNANISRIPVLVDMFPDAIILVPVRNPLEQAASLHRQHMNFLEKHGADDFVKKYMADIGHFEFGELHRAIDFPEVDHLLADLKPESCDYWLAYWLSAFQYLNQCSGITFVSYASLCRNGEHYLSKLCRYLDVDASPSELNFAAQNIASDKQPKLGANFSEAFLSEPIFSERLSLRAQALYEKLLEKSL